MIITFFGGLNVVVYGDAPKPTPAWIKDNKLVAHAFGGINGDTYTNSLDAFLSSYNNGFRGFECDLILTTDGVLVAKHDWLPSLSTDSSKTTSTDVQEHPLSYNEFMSQKILDKYIPLSFEDIAKLMHKYKDMYIITDTKSSNKEDVIRAFKAIYDAAEKVDKSILGRIIPQIYNQDMLGMVKSVYDFKDIIYTLYQSNDSDEEVLDFAVKNRITAVTMPLTRCSKDFSEKLKKIDIPIYTHTVNSLNQVKEYEQKGIYGFYTDFLKP
jgi:glycerophosphoryl diester phosphodiesterase